MTVVDGVWMSVNATVAGSVHCHDPPDGLAKRLGRTPTLFLTVEGQASGWSA